MFESPPKKAYDPNFQLETETYEGSAVFLLELQLKPDAAAGRVGDFRGSALPDLQRQGVHTAAAPHGQRDPDHRPRRARRGVRHSSRIRRSDPRRQTNAAAPTSAPAGPDSQGLGAFLLVAFGVGLAAIFTPCVFPMIPITMSFFLNRQGTRRESVFHAALFCLGIVVLFSGLGLLTTAILGPFGVVQLGSNPWVNGFIALVFLAFGLSLLGAFEITIPSALLTQARSGCAEGRHRRARC